MRRINTRLLLVIGIAVSLLWVVFVWFQTSRLLEDTGQQVCPCLCANPCALLIPS